MKIAVVGIGKLGTELAQVFALKHTVIGIDTDEDRVAQAPFPASTDLAQVEDADIAFVVINTTHSIDDLRPLVQELHRRLASIEKPIVITSTVPPGTTEELSRRICQRAGYRRLVYNPVFIGQGRIQFDLLNPDVILIGCQSEELGKKVAEVWMSVLDPAKVSPSQYVLTTPITAEIAKLALNVCLCTKIHLGNVLADVCRNYVADNETLLRVLELDSRINTAYMKPGMGFGGPCLPIDLLTFNRFAEDPVFTTLYMTNALRVKHLALDLVAAGMKRVAVLGLTYKCDVPIIEEGPGLALVNELELLGVHVYPHDPILMLPTRAPCGFGTADHAIELAQAVVIALPYPEYAELDYTGKYVIDPWGVIK